jgi:hypothetical protein
MKEHLLLLPVVHYAAKPIYYKETVLKVILWSDNVHFILYLNCVQNCTDYIYGMEG